MGEEGCHRLRCGRRGARASFLPGSEGSNEIVSPAATSEYATSWLWDERASAKLCRWLPSGRKRRRTKFEEFTSIFRHSQNETGGIPCVSPSPRSSGIIDLEENREVICGAQWFRGKILSCKEL